MKEREGRPHPAGAGSGWDRLERVERWLRTHPRHVGAAVAATMLATLLVQDTVDEHLWLVFTYAFPVALAGYGLGLQGGVAAALVAAAFLYDHAVRTLGIEDTVFVLATRLAGSLAVALLCALASSTARAREQYIASRARLAQLQEDLVAAFAHDIRSPLSAILGYAAMLREETEGGVPPGELVSGLRRIEANALHVDDMIEEMLSVEQADGAVRNVVTSFTADELLDRLRGELAPIARGREQQVAWLVAPGTPPLETDRRKLLSVVRNLVGNALKYAPGSAVTVSVRYDAATGTHRIEVGDQGPGIPRDALPHLFDRFYRVGGARDAEGFGLGLFIVKRMMDMLGGEVSVRSELGRGSRFLLVVPRLHPEPAVVAEARAS
ncbi:MAG: HAMP domain-containing sensor histidine kinase [Thermodesulfobacteriota bacterium]